MRTQSRRQTTQPFVKQMIKFCQWFSDNQMKANHDKLHLNGKTQKLNRNCFQIQNTDCEKLLGVLVDCELKFKNYIDSVIKKPSSKVNALSRVTPFASLAKKRMLIKSFF